MHGRSQLFVETRPFAYIFVASFLYFPRVYELTAMMPFVSLAQMEKIKLSEGLRVREVQVLPNGKKRVYDEHDGANKFMCPLY